MGIQTADSNFIKIKKKEDNFKRLKRSFVDHTLCLLSILCVRHIVCESLIVIDVRSRYENR